MAAGVPLPRALRPLVWRKLAERIGMDLSEAELDISEYSDFGRLFVRRLKAGRRPVDPASDAVISPVDGCISASGRCDAGRLIQAKGIDYRLVDLVADTALADALDGGVFVTIYLRPRDYHRIHCPTDIRVRAMRRIAGTLLPVQPALVRQVPGLFAKNERVVIDGVSPFGRMALVFVGATAVGAISTTLPDDPQTEGLVAYRQSVPRFKGEEIGAFHLGSTVIAVFERGVKLKELAEGTEIRLGQPIGHARRLTIVDSGSDDPGRFGRGSGANGDVG